jgi:short-subunit dehydrogenase
MIPPAPPRTALVTGASSGIGRALALALARRGTHVVAAARRAPELDALVDEIAAAGGRAEALVLDVADGDAACAAVAALDERLPLDLLVANAGTGDHTPGYKLKWPVVKRILSVNLVGAAATICGALPGMVARKQGHIVGISSIAGFRGLPRMGAYSASKAGMNALLESLRVDLQGSGVHVTTICPGFIRTDMTKAVTRPFIMKLDDAVAEIVRAIDAGAAEVSFPLPIAGPARALPFVPNAVYDWIAGRMRRYL